ncbi:MAG: methyltransferase domain-containing protein [Gemmatimonadota bacterium]
MTGPDTRDDYDLSRPDGFAAWNEEMVARYDIERYYERAHPVVRWLEARRLDALLRLAAPRPGERVLEVGCGAGHVLERFKTCERTGIDLSVSMLHRTRRRLGASVRLSRASADRLPFGDGAFDVVVCTEVLEHTPDPAAVLAELVRVAGPDGRVVVSIPNEGQIDRAKRVLRRTPLLRTWLRTLAAEGNEWHLHTFDLRLLRKVAGGAATIRRTVGIPNRLVPLRWVALLGAGPAPGRRPA